jgi:hypothetical protein
MVPQVTFTWGSRPRLYHVAATRLGIFVQRSTIANAKKRNFKTSKGGENERRRNAFVLPPFRTAIFPGQLIRAYVKRKSS